MCATANGRGKCEKGDDGVTKTGAADNRKKLVDDWRVLAKKIGGSFLSNRCGVIVRRMRRRGRGREESLERINTTERKKDGLNGLHCLLTSASFCVYLPSPKRLLSDPPDTWERELWTPRCHREEEHS
jgi:hypothetical protein